jgi:hypothetical protein
MFFHFVWQHFLQHFAFFSCDLLVEKHRNDLFGFNGFYAVQGDALRPDVAYLDFFLLFPPHRGQSRTSAFFFPTDIPLRLLLIFSYRRGHWSSQWRTRGHPRTFADIHHNVLSVSSICVSTVKKCEKPRAVWQKQLRCWPLPCGTQRAQVNNGSFKVTLVVPADERNPEANKKNKKYLYVHKIS